MKEKYMKPEELTPFLTLLFEKAGMGRADAEFSAECMVKTNLWGVDSHGVLRLPIYLKRVMEKVINPTPCIVPVSELDGPMALLDGDAGMGYVVGKAGMVLAIEKAKKSKVLNRHLETEVPDSVFEELMKVIANE